MILNIPNRTSARQRLTPELNDVAVVEIPSTVTPAVVQPRNVIPVDDALLGLMTQMRSSEQLILQASEERSFELDWRAIATHPLVDSVNIGK